MLAPPAGDQLNYAFASGSPEEGPPLHLQSPAFFIRGSGAGERDASSTGARCTSPYLGPCPYLRLSPGGTAGETMKWFRQCCATLAALAGALSAGSGASAATFPLYESNHGTNSI